MENTVNPLMLKILTLAVGVSASQGQDYWVQDPGTRIAPDLRAVHGGRRQRQRLELAPGRVQECHAEGDAVVFAQLGDLGYGTRQIQVAKRCRGDQKKWRYRLAIRDTEIAAIFSCGDFDDCQAPPNRSRIERTRTK